MFEFIQGAKVIVCVGTGGVGKTTVAASLAWGEAQKGRRVLVLTVDPSQRLKTTFQIKELGEWTPIKHPSHKGTLHAAVMDVKKTFDSFILKASHRDPDAKKILNNRLYKQLSTTLGGSQEFTALENLYDAVNSGQFDLVVLDTPPAQHAMDFLTAPEKLASLFTEGVARWFRDSGGKSENFWISVFQTGTKQVLKALELLTGSEFMRELGEFFRQIQNWQTQLEKRAVESHKILVSPTTHFLMVTAFDEGKFRESEKFAREVQKNGYRLSGLIINRAFPLWLREPVRDEHTDKLFQSLKNYYQTRAKRISDFAMNSRTHFEVLQLPELDDDVCDVKSVERFSQVIESGLAGIIESGKGA